jgi:hypothetical protein
VLCSVPKKPNGCFGDAGFGISEGVDLDLWVSWTLGARDAALAKGELRAGRVLGLSGPSAVGATDTWAEASGKAAGSSCGGDPGGVVLPSLIGLSAADRSSVTSADGTEDGDSELAPFMLNGSGFGVAEGDLDFAWGVGGNGISAGCSDDEERSSSSPLAASSSETSSSESSEEKLSDKNDCVSSSRSDPESTGLSGMSARDAESSLSLGVETSTKDELCDNEDESGGSPASLSLSCPFDASSFPWFTFVSVGTEDVRAAVGVAEVASSGLRGGETSSGFSCVSDVPGSVASSLKITGDGVLGFSELAG